MPTLSPSKNQGSPAGTRNIYHISATVSFRAVSSEASVRRFLSFPPSHSRLGARDDCQSSFFSKRHLTGMPVRARETVSPEAGSFGSDGGWAGARSAFLRCSVTRQAGIS